MCLKFKVYYWSFKYLGLKVYNFRGWVIYGFKFYLFMVYVL
jgi:hypothetical protein